MSSKITEDQKKSDDVMDFVLALERAKDSKTCTQNSKKNGVGENVLNLLQNTLIKSELETAVKNAEGDLPISPKVSSWMATKIKEQQSGDKQSFSKKNDESDGKLHDELVKCFRYMTEIIHMFMGFRVRMRDEKDGFPFFVSGNLNMLIDSKDKLPMTAYEYGYLLAQDKKKISISEAKEFIKRKYFLSSSSVGRLFLLNEFNLYVKEENESLNQFRENGMRFDDESIEEVLTSFTTTRARYEAFGESF